MVRGGTLRRGVHRPHAADATGGAASLNNEILMVDLGSGGRDAVIIGVGYDVTITANDPSWLAHASFSLVACT